MVEVLAISERRACSYAGLSRTSFATPTDDGPGDPDAELAHSGAGP